MAYTNFHIHIPVIKTLNRVIRICRPVNLFFLAFCTAYFCFNIYNPLNFNIMKTKVFASMIAILLIGSACFSQPGHGPKPPTIKERLKMISHEICKPLNLDKTQTNKVKDAFEAFFVEMDKMIDKNVFPPVLPERSKVEPFEKIRDEKVKLIIPAGLFPKYLELEKASRPKDPCEGRP